MAINLTNEERRELSRSDFLIRRIPTDDQPWATYHNDDGQEFRLPSDSYSIQNYRARGFKLGNAPAELKAQFLASAATRRGPEMQYYSENANSGNSSELVSLVKDLMEEVRQLRAEREGGKRADAPVVTPENAVLLLPAPKPVEPRQAQMF